MKRIWNQIVVFVRFLCLPLSGLPSDPGCFPVSTTELGSCDRDLIQPSKTKRATIQPFMVKTSNSCSRSCYLLPFGSVISASRWYLKLNMLKLNSLSFLTSQLLFLSIMKTHLGYLYSHYLSMIKFQMILPHQIIPNLSSSLSLSWSRNLDLSCGLLKLIHHLISAVYNFMLFQRFLQCSTPTHLMSVVMPHLGVLFHHSGGN